MKTGQAAVTAAASVTVPGTLDVTATVTSAAAEGDVAGFVVLTRGADVRRIPYWLHVERPKLRQADEDADQGRQLQRRCAQGPRRRELLPLSGGRQPDPAQRPRAGVRPAHRPAGVELRRARRVAGQGRQGDAEGRAEQRREPAHRLRRAYPETSTRTATRSRARSSRQARSCRAPEPTASSSTRRAVPPPASSRSASGSTTRLHRASR